MSSSASSAIRDATRGGHVGISLVDQAVSALRGGDAEGLHFLYVRFAAEVRDEVGESHADEVERLDELTQEVFARLPGAIEDYDETAVDFERWLADFASSVADEASFSRPRHG